MTFAVASDALWLGRLRTPGATGCDRWEREMARGGHGGGAVDARARRARRKPNQARALQLVLGNSWSVCPFRIALLSAPMFAASIWAMRGLAPTNQILAGAALGLFSGALGASIYGLHCPELAPPFLAIWYVLGILIPTILGSAIGRPLLRW